MQIKNLQTTIEYLTRHMLNVNDSTSSTENTTTATARPSSLAAHTSEQVKPIVIKKTPKFGSRDRHLAIRRKRATTTNSPTESEKSSEIFSFDQSSSTSSECECDTTSQSNE